MIYEDTSSRIPLNGRYYKRKKQHQKKTPRSPPPASAGADPSSSVPCSEESVEVSGVILRASDLARALANEAVAKARSAVAATAGAKSDPKSTEKSAEEYKERMEAQKVEICIEAHIRAAGEEEEARDRATATRRRRTETKQVERYEKAWIKRERTEAERRGSYQYGGWR